MSRVKRANGSDRTQIAAWLGTKSTTLTKFNWVRLAFGSTSTTGDRLPSLRVTDVMVPMGIDCGAKLSAPPAVSTRSPTLTLVNAVSSMRLNNNGRSDPCPSTPPVSRRTVTSGSVDVVVELLAVVVPDAASTCPAIVLVVVVVALIGGVVVEVV